jgi:hypothetical protein
MRTKQEIDNLRKQHLIASDAEMIMIELLTDIRELLQAGEDRIARLEQMAEEHRQQDLVRLRSESGVVTRDRFPKP